MRAIDCPTGVSTGSATLTGKTKRIETCQPVIMQVRSVLRTDIYLEAFFAISVERIVIVGLALYANREVRLPERRLIRTVVRVLAVSYPSLQGAVADGDGSGCQHHALQQSENILNFKRIFLIWKGI